jgi:multidrug efflux pump subunit AcrB
MPTDPETTPPRRSVSRFFVSNPHVSWVLLVGVIAWGVWAYAAMPKRKDPDIPVRQIAVVTPWPGQSAERVEQLVTRKIEERVAQNIRVAEITSTTRAGLSVVYAEVDETARIDPSKEFDDIKVKLDALTDLPEGAGPLQFIKEFGETSALMLTVASPPASGPQVRLLAELIASALPAAVASSLDVVLCSSGSPDPSFVREAAGLLGDFMVRQDLGTDLQVIDGGSFAIIRIAIRDDVGAAARAVRRIWEELPQRADIHPDVWDPIVITPGVPLADLLAREAGPKYSYRELDDFSDRLEKAIRIAPEASRVTRVGVIEEQIEARYSQNRLAALGIVPAAIRGVLQSRNTTLPAGTVNAEGRELALEQTGEFRTLADIDTVVFTQAANGTPVYLRDIGSVHRGYEHPPRLVSYYTWRDASGQWLRGRAITLSAEMKKGEQIDRFGTAVRARVDEVRRSLPADLVIGTTSDQQRQVREKLDLFNRSLWEAVLLVVLVSFVGFWEWRSALLMALSIPITLAMTFGLMQIVGLDIQQMSIASLIIALGLLVDDPVVAGDAIKRELAQGRPRSVAAWLGPDKLSKAILYATITNIAAYLPFLLLNGDVGRYIYSLPVTIACSLVASRVMSMTFLPLLAYYILKPGRDEAADRPREGRFGRAYERAVTFAIDYRWKVLAASSLALVLGGFFVAGLHRQFFPRDDFYIAYVDIRLPEDAPLAQTARVAREADQLVREVTAEYDRTHGESSLASITSFVGAGGPRFWFSVRPEPPAPNYAQLLLQFSRSEDTNRLVGPLQAALGSRVAGARIDVRTVETGPPTVIPVSMRILGDEARVLRQEAEKLQAILKTSPFALNVRDDWGNDAIRTRLEIDQDRAGLAGVSSHDIAISMYSGVAGAPIGYLREGRKNIPIVQLMEYGQRETVTDLGQLYVYSSQTPVRLTLGQIAQLTYSPEMAVIRRVNQYRAINVAALPAPGHLADEVTTPLMSQIRDFEQQLPPGYRFEIVGELKEQLKGQRRSLIVVIASVIAIYLALVFQFKNAVKPFIVFAGIPFGAAGAFASLWVTGKPMGFLAILGITSLIGVIVSHVIVLFDFIEEQHERGAPLREALIEAGIRRIRPVVITVGATVLALFPLALHGGPLWEALCYAQIGGLTLATVVTLYLVPVFYAVCVFDLKVVKWVTAPAAADGQETAAAG